MFFYTQLLYTNLKKESIYIYISTKKLNAHQTRRRGKRASKRQRRANNNLFAIPGVPRLERRKRRQWREKKSGKE